MRQQVNFHDTQPFALADHFIREFANQQPEWGPVGYVTYKRTYARDLETSSHRVQRLAEDYGVTGSEEFWLTCVRVVEGVFQTQQRHCIANKLPWRNAKAQKLAQDMFRRMFAFKWLPPGRGLWMMGTEYVEKHGGAALNNCFTGDTRFFTEGRLVALADAVGEEVYVHTGEGQLQNGVVRSFGVQRVRRVAFAPVGLRSNFRLFYDVTANHRWILSGGKETTTLSVGDKVTVKPLETHIPSITKSAAFLHGLFFGDGTRHTYYPKRHIIRLCGEKIKHRDALEASPYFKSTRPVKDSLDVIVTLVLPDNISWKALPTEEASLAYQTAFLAGWLATDGSSTKNGYKLTSTKEDALDWLVDRAPMLGYCVTGRSVESVMETNFGKRNAPLGSVTLVRAVTEYVVKEIVDEGREEEVFCVTVPGDRRFTLEGGIVTGNCAFVSTNNLHEDFSAPFCFLMDMSMLGAGVGSDTRGAGSVLIQRPSRDMDDTHVVTDSREGWVALVRRYLDAHVGLDILPGSVNYSEVRPYGAKIRGFGGTASGPEPLHALVTQIEQILKPFWGKYITSQGIVDLFNVIGRCVVAGNVRRSAEIMFGDPDDAEFADLKNSDVIKSLKSDELKKHPQNMWRWVSNNSLFAKVGMDYNRHAERTARDGEPGYEWLDTARHYGRLKDAPDHADMRVLGCNPCNEQSLESFEMCCLVENFPANCEDYDDFEATLRTSYLYAKTVTLIPTHDLRTNAVMSRNRRIGCSMSGIVQAIAALKSTYTFMSWCDDGYAFLKTLDAIYSEWLGIPKSVRRTSVKPSGTVSLLCGATPGMHYPEDRFYFRVIRFDTQSPLVAKLRDAGYRVIEMDPAKEPNTTVVYFPVREKLFTRGKRDVSMWEQLELAAQLQYYWSDNQVSCTVTFKPEEASQIAAALELYQTRLKGISFLPLRESVEDYTALGYEHIPYQRISHEEWLAATANMKPVDYTGVGHEQTDKFCDGDACAVVRR